MPRKAATTNTTEVLKFDAVNIPPAYESQEKSLDKWVTYGVDNLYPYFLLRLYNDSPIHSSIVNSKANYIIGDGLNANGSLLNIKLNAADTIQDFLNKVVKDYLIYNYFCIEVIYNKFNEPVEYYFVPAHKIRTNRDKTKFWYFDDLQYNASKYIIYDRWSANNKDSKSKLFFFDGYNPSPTNIYPKPEYNGCLKSILTDIEIRDFNLNNIRNHFSVSTIITFFRGSNIAEDVKKKIIADLKASYTGANGKKMIVDFQDPNNPSADVKNVSPNDWDKAYQLVSQSVSEDIYKGHGIVSPMLFGVKTEGQLGGATELETAYEIMKENYVRNKRNELESAFNMLFSGSKVVGGKIEFADRQLFASRISEDLKGKIYTINELRALDSKPPLPNGDRLLEETATQPTQVQPTQPANMSKAVKIDLTEEDFEKIKDMGISSEEFDFIEDGEFITCKEDFKKIELAFEDSQDIADYILNNDVSGMDLKAIKAAIRKDLGINVTTDELNTILKNLSTSGVVNVDVQDGKVTVKPAEEKKPVRKTEVMYSYVVRPGYGEPIIDTTRPFCKKLINNNRLYTRQEIQQMAAIFGYDIFRYGGGFYHNPDTNETTSHCRHTFKSKTVVRKTNK